MKLYMLPKECTRDLGLHHSASPQCFYTVQLTMVKSVVVVVSLFCFVVVVGFFLHLGVYDKEHLFFQF